MSIRELILDTLEKEAFAKGEARGFKKGIKQGMELESTKNDLLFVNNFLEFTDFDNEKIASLVDVSIDFVEKQRKKRK